jgi:hypothetical protein
MYDKFKIFERIVENTRSYVFVISDRGSSPFFENKDNSCLLPRVAKSIPRKAKIKNRLKTGTKISEQPFITKLVIPLGPTDLFGRSCFIAL